MADPDVMRSLGRIEGKLDAMHDNVDALWRHSKSVEDRVDTLESSQDKQRGILAAVGAIAGFIGSAVMLFFQSFR